MFSAMQLTFFSINRSGFQMFMSKFLLPRKKATNPLIGDHYHFFFLYKLSKVNKHTYSKE